VSAAGGVGALGLMPVPLLRRELRRARELAPGRPLAVNLLMPFVKAEHVAVCTSERPSVAALFCGYSPPLRGRPRPAPRQRTAGGCHDREDQNEKRATRSVQRVRRRR
jgi:hypothetical protein